VILKAERVAGLIVVNGITLNPAACAVRMLNSVAVDAAGIVAGVGHDGIPLDTAVGAVSVDDAVPLDAACAAIAVVDLVADNPARGSGRAVCWGVRHSIWAWSPKRNRPTTNHPVIDRAGRCLPRLVTAGIRVVVGLHGRACCAVGHLCPVAGPASLSPT
jgi:hypothetical protein